MTCQFCGSEKVVVDKTKDGHPYLRDYGANHYYTCPARNGPKAKKKAKKPKMSEEDREMLEALTEQFDKKRAKELLAYAVGATFEARYRAVLAQVNKE